MPTDEEAIRAESDRREHLSKTDADFNVRLNMRDSNVARASEISAAVTAAVTAARDDEKNIFIHAEFERRIGEIEKAQKAILCEQAKVNRMKNWGKGGIAAVLAIGAIIMWGASLGEHIAAIFKAIFTR